jgi:phage tail sheath gpL-like
MSTSIIIPGLTPDDKVPGIYQNIRNGVGRRGASGSILCILLGHALPDTPAENSAVVKVGAGPDITVSGDAEAQVEYVVTISTGGAPGTGAFGITGNGASIAAGVTIPTTPFTYAIPGGNGITITFENDTYVLSNTYTWTSYPIRSNATGAANTLYDVFDEEAGKAIAGPGSEGDVMCKAALSVGGVTLKFMPIEIPDGAEAAELTIELSGSWDESGEVAVRLGKKTVGCVVLADDEPDDVAERWVSNLSDDERLFCSAAVQGNDVVLTVKSPGVRGNDWGAFLDLSRAPAGFIAELDGGDSMIGGGVRFDGGVGTDDLTDVLEALLPVRAPMYNFYGSAANDAVNMAALRDQMIAKIHPLVQEYEQACFGHNGDFASVVTLAQGSANHPQVQVIFDEEGESHPCEIAALEAAIRAVTEGSNPKPNYSQTTTRVRRHLAPRATVADAAEPNHAKLKALLNAGVSPLRTVDGVKVMVRAITSKSLTNGSPDYTTLDVGETTVPMRAAREIAALWAGFSEENPDAGPDPNVDGGEQPAPAGVATPSGWKGEILPLLHQFERNRWIHLVNENPPIVEWDADAKRIMSATPVVVRPLNLQLGNEVRQVAS